MEHEYNQAPTPIAGKATIMATAKAMARTTM
jgi:hypothetical protein